MQTRFSGHWPSSAAMLGLLMLPGCNLPKLPPLMGANAQQPQTSLQPAARMNKSSGASLTEVAELGLDAIVPSLGVLSVCPPAAPAQTQPDWYLPGYQRIGQRRCDGQYVTCGNGYPCAEPTPKAGLAAWDMEYGNKGEVSDHAY